LPADSMGCLAARSGPGVRAGARPMPPVAVDFEIILV